MNILIRLWRNSITTTFLAGLVLLLPVVLTVLIVAWFIDMLRAALGPGTFLGDLLTTGGTTILGEGYETLSFFLGALIALVGIWFLGLIARSAAKKSMERSIDRIFTKLPIIRTIYNPVSRVVRLATDKTTGDFSAMSVVSCRFGGGENGVDVLALLANQETFYIGDEPRKMIYLPTAPVPMTGGLVLVPEHCVVPVPELKVDDLLRIYFSLGALAPDTLPKKMKPVGHPGQSVSVPPIDPADVDLTAQRQPAE
ncbi:MAG: DUF502 domain-containing protein [Hyphomicrobiales bacterium]|nr:DUF502 domain-containing protein [Hyphomicrobiales bacterium]